MTDHNPSTAAQFLVLAGPALALLFTAFSLATGTGVGFIRGVWFCAALWSLPRRALVRPLAGEFTPRGLVRLHTP